MSDSDQDTTRAKTRPLGVEDLVSLADVMMEAKRYLDASAVYARLASHDRSRKDLLARAHYARGRFYLTQDARTEARMELRRALDLAPDLTEAQAQLDSINTMRLPRSRSTEL